MLFDHPVRVERHIFRSRDGKNGCFAIPCDDVLSRDGKLHHIAIS